MLLTKIISSTCGCVTPPSTYIIDLHLVFFFFALLLFGFFCFSRFTMRVH